MRKMESQQPASTARSSSGVSAERTAPSFDSSNREFLRHALATLAYRAEKVVRDPPEGFEAFRVCEDGRSAGEILAHMGDLMEWAAWLARGEHRWRPVDASAWAADVERFFTGVAALDGVLAGEAAASAWSPERIFQGPVADALTHTGQLALMRRSAGSPVRAENYTKAEIAVGRVVGTQSGRRAER